jgi:hypothetical protein
MPIAICDFVTLLSRIACQFSVRFGKALPADYRHISFTKPLMPIAICGLVILLSRIAYLMFGEVWQSSRYNNGVVIAILIGENTHKYIQCSPNDMF